MAVIDSGNSAAGKANVDAYYNLKTNNPIVDTQAGFVVGAIQQDAGAVSGTRSLRHPQLSRARRLSVGQDQLLFSDGFNNTAQNTGVYKSAATTFTFAQTGGYLVFNNSAITTAASAQVYQTYKVFPLYAGAPLILDVAGFGAAVCPSNATFEGGFFTCNIASTPYTPTDGIYYRVNSTGLYGVVNYNGTETVSNLLLPAAALTLGSNGTYRLIVTEEIAEFWAGDANGDFTYLGSLATPPGNGQPFSAAAAPFSARMYFAATAGSAYQVKLSDITITLGDINSYRPWQHSLAGMGAMGYQGQSGGTMGSTALYTNSLAAGAGAAMTNTTAALGSGLGGQFSTQPTLAAGTDGILCSYQNPAGGVAQTPRTLVITGVKIQGLVTTAFTGGPVLYAYSLAFGHTAVSLATAEAVAAKAARRIALGIETYAVTAAVGVVGQGVSVTFQTPIVINPGEFVAVVAKNLGTVTSAGVITALVTYDAYWE